MQYRYYGKASHMAADLKRTAARVRALHPEYYVTKKVDEPRVNEAGEKTVVTTRTQALAASSSRYYHDLARKP